MFGIVPRLHAKVSDKFVVVVSLLTLSVAACTRPHPEVFDAAVRAATNLSNAVDVGVSYSSMGPLLIALNTEIDLVKARAQTAEELTLVNTLTSASTAFADSYIVLGLRTKHGDRLTPRHDPRVLDLAMKYDVSAMAGEYESMALLAPAWTKGRAYVQTAGELHRKMAE